MAPTTFLILQVLVWTQTSAAIFRRQNNAKGIIKQLVELPVGETAVGVTVSGKEHSMTVAIFGTDAPSFPPPPRPTAPKAPGIDQFVDSNEDDEPSLEELINLVSTQLAAQAAAQEDSASTENIIDEPSTTSWPLQRRSWYDTFANLKDKNWSPWKGRHGDEGQYPRREAGDVTAPDLEDKLEEDFFGGLEGSTKGETDVDGDDQVAVPLNAEDYFDLED